MLLEVLAIAEETGSKPGRAERARGLRRARRRCVREWSRAARFFGAAEAQTAQTGLHRDPADEAFLAPLIARAREALGLLAFDADETAGRNLSDEARLAEARAWLECGR